MAVLVIFFHGRNGNEWTDTKRPKIFKNGKVSPLIKDWQREEKVVEYTFLCLETETTTSVRIRNLGVKITKTAYIRRAVTGALNSAINLRRISSLNLPLTKQHMK